MLEVGRLALPPGAWREMDVVRREMALKDALVNAPAFLHPLLRAVARWRARREARRSSPESMIETGGNGLVKREEPRSPS
jgi:hypothetical protein